MYLSSISKKKKLFFLPIQTSQSPLQLNFKISVYRNYNKFSSFLVRETLVQNICSLRLTDPEIPGFLQFSYVRVNQSASDVGRVGTVLYYNVGAREAERITETVDLISRVYRVCCKRIARRNGRHFPPFSAPGHT